jgi:hypothetical protein
MASKVYPPTNDHLLAFGSIIQDFARFERLVEFCINEILSADYTLTAITISNLGYSAKCQALESLLVLSPWPDQDRAHIVSKFLTDFNGLTPLRNSIAHNPWKKGSRPESIKPLSARSRGGKAKFQGVSDDERDYTAAELFEIANRLMSIHDDFTKFLIGVGAITSIDE